MLDCQVKYNKLVLQLIKSRYPCCCVWWPPSHGMTTKSPHSIVELLGEPSLGDKPKKEKKSCQQGSSGKFKGVLVLEISLLIVLPHWFTSRGLLYDVMASSSYR